VIDNEFCKSLCLRICPEVASFTRVVEVTRSPPPAAESSHDAEQRSREKEHGIYSLLGGALVSTTQPSAGCILHCIGASSTDNFPFESVENTLDPQDMVNNRPSYWSSGGADGPNEPESLTYRLNSDLCVVDEIWVQPFQGTRSCLCFFFVLFDLGGCRYVSNNFNRVSFGQRIFRKGILFTPQRLCGFGWAIPSSLLDQTPLPRMTMRTWM
jgi:hypothetical protein